MVATNLNALNLDLKHFEEIWARISVNQPKFDFKGLIPADGSVHSDQEHYHWKGFVSEESGNAFVAQYHTDGSLCFLTNKHVNRHGLKLNIKSDVINVTIWADGVLELDLVFDSTGKEIQRQDDRNRFSDIVPLMFLREPNLTVHN